MDNNQGVDPEARIKLGKQYLGPNLEKPNYVNLGMQNISTVKKIMCIALKIMSVFTLILIPFTFSFINKKLTVVAFEVMKNDNVALLKKKMPENEFSDDVVNDLYLNKLITEGKYLTNIDLQNIYNRLNRKKTENKKVSLEPQASNKNTRPLKSCLKKTDSSVSKDVPPPVVNQDKKDDSSGNPIVNPPIVEPPIVNPPIVNPPIVNPPIVNPPIVEPDGEFSIGQPQVKVSELTQQQKIDSLKNQILDIRAKINQRIEKIQEFANRQSDLKDRLDKASTEFEAEYKHNDLDFNDPDVQEYVATLIQFNTKLKSSKIDMDHIALLESNPNPTPFDKFNKQNYEKRVDSLKKEMELLENLLITQQEKLQTRSIKIDPIKLTKLQEKYEMIESLKGQLERIVSSLRIHNLNREFSEKELEELQQQLALLEPKPTSTLEKMHSVAGTAAQKAKSFFSSVGNVASGGWNRFAEMFNKIPFTGI